MSPLAVKTVLSSLSTNETFWRPCKEEAKKPAGARDPLGCRAFRSEEESGTGLRYQSRASSGFRRFYMRKPMCCRRRMLRNTASYRIEVRWSSRTPAGCVRGRKKQNSMLHGRKQAASVQQKTCWFCVQVFGGPRELVGVHHGGKCRRLLFGVPSCSVATASTACGGQGARPHPGEVLRRVGGRCFVKRCSAESHPQDSLYGTSRFGQWENVHAFLHYLGRISP